MYKFYYELGYNSNEHHLYNDDEDDDDYNEERNVECWNFRCEWCR